ncbi:unnamed protein product, partial [Symbiodinium sp. KB8]
DGRRFFFNVLNWIEFAVAIVGLISVIVEIEVPFQVPNIDLCCECTGLRGGIKGRINKGVDKLFDHLVRKQLVDFLLMPAENMKHGYCDSPSHVEVFKLDIEKRPFQERAADWNFEDVLASKSTMFQQLRQVYFVGLQRYRMQICIHDFEIRYEDDT